jgi:hypothetical protein
MDSVTTAVIRRWFREMMAFVAPVPWMFRFSVDECVLTLSKEAKVVVGRGQPAFERKQDKLHHFTMM